MANFNTRGLVPLPGFEKPAPIPQTMARPYWENPGYIPYPYHQQHSRQMPGPSYAYPIVQNVDIPIEQDAEIIKTNKVKAAPKRRGSIEGETIKDLVNNIIKEKATLKQTKDAFKKMTEILEDQREMSIFDEF